MQTCAEPRKDKHSPPPPPKKKEHVELTLGVPFSVYKNNPGQFEKRLIKEISEALNIDESQIKFTGAREGWPKKCNCISSREKKGEEILSIIIINNFVITNEVSYVIYVRRSRDIFVLIQFCIKAEKIHGHALHSSLYWHLVQYLWS